MGLGQLFELKDLTISLLELRCPPLTVRSLIRFARSHGLSRATYRVVRAVLSRLDSARWLNLFVADVYTAGIGELKSIRRLPRAFTVRPAGDGDLDRLQVFFAKTEHVTERLARGDLCLMLTAGKEICAAEWLAIGPCDFDEDGPELGCVFRVPEGGCWLYDGKGTSPGAWGSLMGCLAGFLAERSVKRVFSQVEYANVRAARAHESLGCRRAGGIWHLRFFGLSLRRCHTPTGRSSLPAVVGDLEIVANAG